MEYFEHITYDLSLNEIQQISIFFKLLKNNGQCINEAEVKKAIKEKYEEVIKRELTRKLISGEIKVNFSLSNLDSCLMPRSKIQNKLLDLR